MWWGILLITYYDVLSATQLEQAKADTSLGNAFAVAMLWIKRILKFKQKRLILKKTKTLSPF